MVEEGGGEGDPLAPLGKPFRQVDQRVLLLVTLNGFLISTKKHILMNLKSLGKCIQLTIGMAEFSTKFLIMPEIGNTQILAKLEK